MPNRLATESSLYLRQHASNPVDWQAWGDAALQQARTSNKPILLSIGYSACHWCHVMAHESFENPTSAAVMNALFVNIKVDREERPDLDRIYQLAHQALARRAGGWPLTVFLDPHTLLPFYVGTYFPKTPRYGMPSFTDVLHNVRQWWDQHPGEIQQQNAALHRFFNDYGQEQKFAGNFSDTPLNKGRNTIIDSFDFVNGGHRGAPKFPQAGEIQLLLALARRGDIEAETMATATLTNMANRGLYDHLAGGFFRYCVDDHWGIPHFEKMLYDNAQLLSLYAEAASQFITPHFRETADGIVTWLQTEMRADGGGFCSALDADSEGEEGKFYVWTREEFFSALDPSIAMIAERHYGLNREPNFENTAWHLQIAKTPAEIAIELAVNEAQTATSLRQARKTLAEYRRHRVHPARDDKRLTAWNALLCTALAKAGNVLQREDWVEEASGIFDALIASMDEHGRLPAVLGAHGHGFLDDHAFALQAAIAMLEARWSSSHLHVGMRLADALLRDFADSKHGGFFFTAHDHETLPQRPKPWLDDATPSGNAIAALALLDLGFLLTEPRYIDAAEATLRAAWATLNELPQGAASMLTALIEFQNPTPLVIIRGDAQALPGWRQQLRVAWHQPLKVFAIAGDAAPLPTTLEDKPNGQATLCCGMRCLASCDNVEELLVQLKQLS